MTAHAQTSAETRLRQMLAEELLLQAAGTTNANHALLAKRAGCRAVYLSGGGMTTDSLGLPGLNISGSDDVLTDVRRITDVCDVPLLVDVDTGFDASAFSVVHTTKSLTKFGATAMHIGDQVGAKRCGHRPNKEIVSKEEMVDRVKAAVNARIDANFVITARIDALAIEGLNCALERAVAYVGTGADAIFSEAMTELSMYRKFVDEVKTPVLVDITEFGQTPLFTCDELASAGMSMILYSLSAFRAMNRTAENVYAVIRRDGTQQNIVDTIQTRMELHDSIGYHDCEAKLDALLA